jgi:hypothetical protein
MGERSMPREPGRRKAIVILEEHEIDRCRYESDGARLLHNPEVQVLTFPGEKPCPLVQDMERAGLFRPGTVLVQNPFDRDSYAEIDEATERFALHKQMLFSEFCRHLGAREVVVDMIEIRTTTGKATFEAKAGRAGVEGGGSVTRDQMNAFRSQISLQDRFEGAEPDVAAAETLLVRSGLASDPTMRSLLELRRPGGNKLASRTLTLNLSTETKRSLAVVGNLKVPAYVKLQADYRRIAHEQREYTLTLRVLFS